MSAVGERPVSPFSTTADFGRPEPVMTIRTRCANRKASNLTPGLFAVCLLAGVATMAWADTCEQRCRVGYESAVRFCRGDEGFDAEDLKECLENAQRDYQNCLQDCKG